ncbi:GbsR/MarR family transcriptional regulator [Silvimonas iriomotensis]|uniref:HTH-type transcriptional regulator n=1 Tax=Silvimonas iriomotensis TaxID=449662 RepID=A0ABQ2P8W8_9NEIS|nr:MarR family transcriptional regulator [Silvimonas iriomotensis]GGP21040.1 transcriptional regulator [Silvimonas iriomotensis]
MKLSPTTEKYILHWGEMGTRWGVNRTVAQIHALLFLSNTPLNAEEICETLNVARSNVSNSLKELQSWGLIRTVRVLTDRRDHFEAEQEVSEIFRLVVEGRKTRELDPTLTVLRQCSMEAESDAMLDAASRKRMDEVLAFLELLMGAYDDFRHLSPATMQRVLKMGGKIARFLGPDDKEE